jgi:hypothetical protein
VKIQVIDAFGVLAQALCDGIQLAGSHDFKLNIRRNGIYTVVLTLEGNKQYTTRIVKGR